MQIRYQTHKVTNSVVHSFCHEKDYCESFIKNYETKPIKGYTYKIYCCNNTFCNTRKDLNLYGVVEATSLITYMVAVSPLAITILLIIFLFFIIVKKIEEKRNNSEERNFMYYSHFYR